MLVSLSVVSCSVLMCARVQVASTVDTPVDIYAFGICALEVSLFASTLCRCALTLPCGRGNGASLKTMSQSV